MLKYPNNVTGNNPRSFTLLYPIKKLEWFFGESHKNVKTEEVFVSFLY